MAFVHEPVLLAEVLQWMNVRENGVYADGTLGGGGHSGAMLEASGGTATPLPPLRRGWSSIPASMRFTAISTM